MTWYTSFSLSDEQFLQYSFWVSLHYIIFALSWIPVWRRKWRQEKMMVWRRRKSWTHWLLYNPTWWYNGILWSIMFGLAGTGIYKMFDNDEQDGTVQTVAMWFHITQLTFFATWPIPVFYWNLPFWGTAWLYLNFCGSLTVLILYGKMDLEAFGYYLPYAIGTFVLPAANTVLWIRLVLQWYEDTENYPKKRDDWFNKWIGNPVLIWIKHGFSPIYSKQFYAYYSKSLERLISLV